MINFTDTFTFTCPWGCTVSVERGTEQPHTCDGTSAIVDAMRVAPTGATVLELAEHIARALDPTVRERLGASWEDGVRMGRSGVPCAGVDATEESK